MNQFEESLTRVAVWLNGRLGLCLERKAGLLRLQTELKVEIFQNSAENEPKPIKCL